MFCIIVLGTIRVLTRRPQDQRRPVTPAGQWRAALRREGRDTRRAAKDHGERRVLDQHVVATVPGDDPDYEAQFLTAMNTARERAGAVRS